MEVIPQSSTIGAEVRGLDLAGKLSDALIEQVNQAFLDYQVLFFRDQELSPENHKELALRFGPIQIHLSYPHVDGHPEICVLENSETNLSKIDTWHTDMTFRPYTPCGPIMRSIEVPASCGSTVL